MDKNQKKEIKLKILENIKKSEILIVEYKEVTKPIPPENAIGRISRMDAINNKSVNEASLRQTEQKLAMLKIALSKIDEDDFGMCIKCKKEIPIGRILIRPQSRLCVNCAS